MKLSQKEILDAENKAYKDAGHNAYFGNGFNAGVKFAEKAAQLNLLNSMREKGDISKENYNYYYQVIKR